MRERRGTLSDRAEGRHRPTWGFITGSCLGRVLPRFRELGPGNHPPDDRVPNSRGRYQRGPYGRRAQPATAGKRRVRSVIERWWNKRIGAAAALRWPGMRRCA